MMKNKSFKKSVSFICIYVILNIIFILSAKVKTASASIPKIVFPVISDVHIGGIGADIKYREVLRQSKELYSNYDAITVVGDITDQGKETQYKTFMQILKMGKPPAAEAILAMGKHEYREKDLTDKGYENRFVRETGMPGLYYDKWIKGYHFIVLAPENNIEAKLSEEQLRWLNNKLVEEEKINKPIFVFLHQPFPNTVYGSHSWGHMINYKKLFSILKNHPQVIFFSGHSHYSLENCKTRYKKGFNMFNTGAVYYIMAADDRYCNYKLNQGLFVEVYDKEVIVRCREFSKYKWIGKVYTIKTTHK
jgi:3',5'-cyclic-AMP phosphodiesterase